jgi:hypothetical protein
MKRKQVIQWLQNAENYAKHLKDAADGKSENCSVFSETSIFATQLMNVATKQVTGVEAMKQNIACYVETWILPNIKNALEEVKKEPRWKRNQQEAERRETHD